MAGHDETSVWKKEISFRRKPKPPAADAPMATPAQTSVWKKEVTFRRKPKPPAADAPMATPAQTSVWKKEISFGRKPKPPKIDTPAAAPAETSVWKKEISFGRKPKTDVGRPVPERPAPEAPAVTARPPEQAFVPPVMPPVSPSETTPATPFVAPAAPAAPAARVAPLPVAPEPVPEAERHPGETMPTASTVVAEPAPSPAPAVGPVPGPAPEQTPSPSRRDRRNARRAADRLSKERRKLAKQDRKTARRTHNRVVGLKVGASQVAVAEVINKGGPRVVRMARVPLERGVVVGGELRQPEELAAVLKTLFRKNKLTRTRVRLGIANNRIGVRTFEITGIEDPKQLANAIRFRAQETLPIPLDEAVLDYRILDEKTGDDGVNVRRVLLVVAHRELVERYVAACRKAGLRLIGIDLEAFALLRALADPAHPPANDAAVVCISIGHDRSTLAVSDGRVCEFTRVLAWGGSSLDVALARVLDLTPSAVEPIKHRLSLDEEGEVAGLDAGRADEARRAMAAELQVFARELVASLRFYQEQPNSLGIGEILVTGGAAASSGLAAELERLIGLPVRVADPLARVKMPRKLRKRQNGSGGSMTVAVGLGIED